MGLREGYWTVDDLVEKEGKDSKAIKNEKSNLGRKFKKTLKSLGFDEQMINWYRSGQENGLDGRKAGYYIFKGRDREVVKKNLVDLFTIVKEVDQEASYEKMNKIIEILLELLPCSKDENERELLPDKQKRDIKKLFSLLDEIRRLNIFDQYDGKSNARKELARIWKKLEEINKSRVIFLQSEQEEDSKRKYMDYEKKQRRIEERVVSFFLGRINGVYFNNKNFPKGKNCKDFYAKFFIEVRKWHIKWLCLFDNIEKLHEVEDFYNICELFEYCETDSEFRKRYFHRMISLEGKMKEAYESFQKLSIGLFSEYYEKNYDDKKLQEMIGNTVIKEMLVEGYNIKSKKDCLEYCNKFVEAVGRYRYTDNDNKYIVDMKMKALRELEILIKRIENDGSDQTEQSINEAVIGEEYEGIREKFIEYYRMTHIGDEMRREYLECIFSLKYGREETILDKKPYGKLNNDFWEKPIVGE